MQYSVFDLEQNIAQGSLTNSKHPDRFVKGVYPTIVKTGLGSKLVSSDGFIFTDYICALGTNLLGYNHPEIYETICKSSQDGTSHSLPTHYEIEAARKVKEICPIAERVKFVKSGSDGCSLSILIARAYTGRKNVLSDGYHGCHDEFVGLTPPATGVNASPFITKLTDINQIDDTIAAVIIEPIMVDLTPERKQYLLDLRAACDKSGTLLIFDETITALRFPKFFAYRYLGVTPDIVVFGKALAAGLPISCVAGSEKIMNSDYFYSQTYCGEILSLACVVKVIDILQTDHKFNIKTLWEKGQLFIEKFNKLFDGFIKLKGYPTRGTFEAKDDLTKALFFQECCRSALLVGPSWFYNFPLIEDDENSFTSFNFMAMRFKSNDIKLKGEMPTSAFSARART